MYMTRSEAELLVTSYIRGLLLSGEYKSFEEFLLRAYEYTRSLNY